MTAFYREVLGLAVQRELELEGEYISQLLGFPNAHLRIVFLGTEGEQHDLELLQYVNPPDGDGHGPKNRLGTAHLCFNVDDLEGMHRELSGRGVRFVNAPAVRDFPGRGTIKTCYAQDPEGNWLEFMERAG